ncbi:helix-turn-helix domain-containing protein [Spongiibacter sp. KMU-166]|uniref:Helix-turn-helix domain-containing protein n=1 Tax=Spongiibacter thalassae TaxID=2721624 RepID=A0ABX1GA07_9GAMM|nr:helix-turn-helix domain-containing protein [Spongiibacter thalassae]NKI15994.1 helix-turn-helix domain-containing protein [Spongiibacter thalassae]
MANFALLGMDGVYLSSLGAFADAFVMARHRVHSVFQRNAPIEMDSQVQVVAPAGRTIHTACGRSVAADAQIEGERHYDIVHIPSFIIHNTDRLWEILKNSTRVYEWLHHHYERGAIISASGTGVFLVAESGLLNGGKAAILRQLTSEFRSHYPDITCCPLEMVVEHRGILTACGLGADNALMVRILEQTISPEVSRWYGEVTGHYQTPEHSVSEDALTARAQLWMEFRFTQGITIAELAEAMSVSQQTLLRHFRKFLGMTPRDYLKKLRVDAACTILTRTDRSVDQVAALVGYSDVQSFRKAFREQTGSTAMAYRKQEKYAATANVAKPASL